MNNLHYHIKSFSTFVFLTGLLMLAASSQAATIVWSGASGTDTNWSNGNNWVGNVKPAGGDDVKFYNSGTNGAAGTVNNLVDGSFAGYIGSLQYGNTNGFHTTSITNGQTLNITNTGGLTVGTPGDIGVAYTNRATITGSGGTLNVSNASAVISLNQGTATTVNFAQAILDLSGLDNFNATVSRIGLGTTTTVNPGNAVQREAGTLYLAKTNFITVNYSVPLATYQTLSSATNGIELQKNPGNNAGSTTATTLYLGLTNVINVDSIGIGRDKSDASCLGRMLFNPAFTNSNPVAYFYGVTGPGSRVTWYCVGDDGGAVSSSHGGDGTNDFTGGTVNAFVNVMSLGRDSTVSSTWAGPNKGALIFTAGTIDVNTLLVGNQSLGPTTSTTPNVGAVTMNGANALLRVNATLTLGNTSNSVSTAAQNTYGTLSVNNGTVLANNVTVGAFTTSANNAIVLNNAMLVVTNSIATNATGLATFNMTNSTLGLTVPANAALAGLVKTLSLGGATNLLQLSVPVFASYPQTIPLVQYTTLNGAFNFGLTNIPGSAPGAYLTNLTITPKSIAVVLPTNPAPVITVQPQPFSGSPGNTVILTVTNTGNTPLSYQWYYTNGVSTNTLSDGPGPSGSSTLTGSTSNVLTITSAQTNDSGGYFAVVTNLYGSATSTMTQVTISLSAVLPSVTGPTNLTVIAGNNATINDSASGSPVPALQWLDQNGVPIVGQTGSTLVLNNVQYSQNGYTYSLVATNIAGMATNITTLTVIVAPAITLEPTNVVVTNTQAASFSVAATGVPNPGYQWKKNGVPISSAVNNTATNATFTIASTSPSDTSSYSCLVTNLAGSTNSATVTLTVNSTMAATTFAPANGLAGVCYDTPLYLTFSAIPVLQNVGTIKIYNVTNSATPVDTINLSLSSGGVQPRSNFPGDSQGFNYYPVIITGTTAAIYPHSGVMTSNQTYYMTIDDGTFADTSGAYFSGITATNVWQFTTKPTGAANATNMVVAQDYSGDFATVQGAVDSVPAANSTPTLINIKNGNYVEIVDISGKNNLILRGQSRAATIVGYPNNASIAAGGGSTHARMAFKVNANDIALDNLTITNSTAQDFSQAEALMIESGAARLIVNNCNIDSYQDTILANISTSKAYFNNSLVQGDVDFIWGGGNLFFTNCEVRWLIRAANGQAEGPNPSPSASDLTSNGFSFVSCSLTTLPGANPADIVGRTRSITNGNTALINCFVSTNIGGWGPDAVPTNNFRNWYYNCTNDLGASVTLSNGIALSSGDPNVALARSATTWLYGWVPQLSPNILTNPVNQSISGGGTATFTVAATGIPNPTYQWLSNSIPISGQTGSSLTISSANANNAGSYSVIVSNSAGVVTSGNASLTVGNTSPMLTPVSDQTVNVGANVNIANVATDPDVPAQTLTFTLPIAPSGAAVDGNGNFTWRPTVSFADTSNPVQVVVTDNGTPNLSATNSFNIIVNLLTQPVASAPIYSGGQFSVTVSGQAGPDYEMQATTNLVGGTWVDIATTNSPASPFTLTDTNAAAPAQFYRIVTGPPLP